MNSRQKGRKLELLEAADWKRAGWEVEARHPAKFVGPGRTVLCDFFDKYDVIVASFGTVVFIQTSTESESSHEGPLDLMPQVPVFSPDQLLRGAVHKPGVYEVYSYWRRLKGRGWTPDRRWWVKDDF